MYIVHATKIWTWTTQRLASTLCGPHSRYSPAWKSWKSTSQAECFIHKAVRTSLKPVATRTASVKSGLTKHGRRQPHIFHICHTTRLQCTCGKPGCRTFWEAACEELPPAKGFFSPGKKLKKGGCVSSVFCWAHWLAFSLLNLAYALGSSKFTKRRFKTCFAVGSTSKESPEIIGTNQKKNKCRNLATKTQRTQRLLGQKVRGLTVQSATNQEPSCIQSFLLPNPPS